MAQARYTVLRPFEHDGTKMKLGFILVLDTEDAQPLLEKGSLRFDKYLNPHDPKDATEIDFFRGNPSGKRKAKPVAAAPSAPLPPEEEEPVEEETTDQKDEEVVEETTEASTEEEKQEETAAAPEEKTEETVATPAPKKTDTKKKGK